MAVEIKTGRIRGYEEICIFENQRYRPLFGWGSKGFLFPKERSMYSDESGEVSFAVSKLDEIPAPPGYEWATGWKIDLKSDSVDSEGWCYARTFAKLSENLSSGKSANVPRPGHVVRRRMWTRYARRIRPSVTSFGRDEPVFYRFLTVSLNT